LSSSLATIEGQIDQVQQNMLKAFNAQKPFVPLGQTFISQNLTRFLRFLKDFDSEME
jgi:hypothetical protein